MRCGVLIVAFALIAAGCAGDGSGIADGMLAR